MTPMDKVMHKMPLVALVCVYFREVSDAFLDLAERFNVGCFSDAIYLSVFA